MQTKCKKIKQIGCCTLYLFWPFAVYGISKLAVLVYRALNGTAPRHLSEQLIGVGDMPSRTCLRSSSSSHLAVRPSHRVTVGHQSFATAGPWLWNSLPDDITTAPALTIFRRRLNVHLFRQSYPDIILQFVLGFFVATMVRTCSYLLRSL